MILESFFNVKAAAWAQHRLQIWYFWFQAVLILVAAVGQDVPGFASVLLVEPMESILVFRKLVIRSKQRDPKPEDNSLIRKEASTYRGFYSTFAALFSYDGVFVRVRVPLFATQVGTVPHAARFYMSYLALQCSAHAIHAIRYASLTKRLGLRARYIYIYIL